MERILTFLPGEKFNKEKLDAALLPRVKKFSYTDESDLPSMNWISNELGLRSGGTYLITGYSNAGKTFFCTYIGLCIHNNLPVFNKTLDECGKVLYLDWELGEDAGLYQYKVRNGLAEQYPDTQLEDFDYADMRDEFYLDDLDSKKIEETLVRLCRGYKVVIVDSMIAAMPRTDINDDRCRAYLDLLNRVASKADTCILILHHEGKAGQSDTIKRGKGSSSIMAAVRGSLSLDRKSNGEIQLTTGKKRLSRDYDVFYTLDDCGEYSETLRAQKGIMLNVVTNSTSKEESKEDRMARLLRLVSDAPGINTRAIVHQMAGKTTHTKEILDEAIALKLIGVEKVGQTHKHTITSEGMARLQYEVQNG